MKIEVIFRYKLSDSEVEHTASAEISESAFGTGISDEQITDTVFALFNGIHRSQKNDNLMRSTAEN